MSDYKVLMEAVLKGDIKAAVAETQKAIDAKDNARDVLDNGLIPAMDDMGDRFSKGIAFVPQMLRAAKTMQECVKLLQPLFAEGDITSKGKVLIGTVKGDLLDLVKKIGFGYVPGVCYLQIPPVMTPTSDWTCEISGF